MNTKDKWLTTARTDDPERKRFWLETVGSEVVPILSIIPTWVDLPGLGSALVYLLDVQALHEEQHVKLMHGVAQRFGLTFDEAEAEFHRNGVPILADGVEVMTSDRGLMANLVLDDFELGRVGPDPDAFDDWAIEDELDDWMIEGELSDADLRP